MVLNYRMRFYLVLFFCVSGFLFGCGDDERIPGDVIPMHQMSLLLTDVHLVDGSIYNLAPVPDTLAKHGLGLYLAVFKLHHTDTTQFKQSLKYYSEHPDKMLAIYEGVVNRLDSLQKAKEKKIKPVAPQASSKSTAQMVDSVKKATAKADSVKKVQDKKTADSIRAVKPKLKLSKAARRKARRDSIRKARFKHPIIIKTI
jgi:hypothetical protein